MDFVAQTDHVGLEIRQIGNELFFLVTKEKKKTIFKLGDLLTLWCNLTLHVFVYMMSYITAALKYIVKCSILFYKTYY